MVSESITSSASEQKGINLGPSIDASIDDVARIGEDRHELTVEPSSHELRQEEPSYPYGRHERTDGITLLSFYHFAWGGLYLLGSLLTAIPTIITGIVGIAEDPEVFIATAILGFAMFFLVGLSLLYFAVGFGLWRLKQWARTAAMALGLISLPTGIGTLPGALTVWYLMKEEVSALFR